MLHMGSSKKGYSNSEGSRAEQRQVIPAAHTPVSFLKKNIIFSPKYKRNRRIFLNSSFIPTLSAPLIPVLGAEKGAGHANEWWEKELGDKRRWMFTHDYKTDQGKYDDTYKGIKWQWISNYKAGKVQSLKFKYIIYKTKDIKGANLVGQAKIDFLESRYKEPQKIKSYNFSRFSGGINQVATDDSVARKSKFDLKNIDFNSNPNNPNDMDPIQTNTTDLNYSFDNEDDITSYNGNNNNNNN